MRMNFETLFEKVPAESGSTEVGRNPDQELADEVIRIFGAAKEFGITQYELIERAFLRLGAAAKHHDAGLVEPGIERDEEETLLYIDGDLSTETVSDEKVAERLKADGITDSDLGGVFIPAAGEPGNLLDVEGTAEEKTEDN